MEKINLKQTYEDSYTMRIVGRGISTSIPKKVVERQAKERGISIEEFIEKYCVVMYYGNFSEIDGAFKFVKKEEVDEG